jgi:hypothetical protein
MKRLILIALTLFPLSCFDGLGTMFDDLTMKVPLCVAPGGSDLNDGRGWGNAKATIQAAVSSASDDDEIWVAAGTYIVHDTGSDVIEINRSVSLFGGFSGNESRKMRGTSIITLQGLRLMERQGWLPSLPLPELFLMDSPFLRLYGASGHSYRSVLICTDKRLCFLIPAIQE